MSNYDLIVGVVGRIDDLEERHRTLQHKFNLLLQYLNAQVVIRETPLSDYGSQITTIESK